MMRIQLSLLLFCIPVHDSAAQLRVDRPLILGHDHQSALIEMVIPPEHGAWYDAVIQGGTLRTGNQTLTWQPQLSCNHPDSRPDMRMCRIQATGALSWHVSGMVRAPFDPAPGVYQGHAVLTVQGPAEAYSVFIPVTYGVPIRETDCTLRSTGRLEFGTAEANRFGTITMDSETGRRKFTGGQEQKLKTSPHQAAILTLTTSAKSVLVTVVSPSMLQSPTDHVGFSSQLAYQPVPGRRYLPLIQGSGSRRIRVDGRQMSFRLGGIVTTYATSLEADYQGSIALTFLCEQIH